MASLQQHNAQHFSQEARAGVVKPHMRDLADLLAAVLPHKVALSTQSTVLLDVGCGSGLLAERLAPLVQSCVGVDVAAGAVEAFNAKTSPPNMRAVCLDITETDSRAAAISAGRLPAQVDVAVCHMTLHHVAGVPALLAAVAGLLRPPSGLLVLTDLLATDSSKLFHAGHAHHTVAHAGGFTQQAIQQFAEQAELQLKMFEGQALHVRKPVQQPGGEQGPQHDFPVFLAVLQA